MADLTHTTDPDPLLDDRKGGGIGVQVFATPSDAPRVRWRMDLLVAAVDIGLLVVLLLVAGDGSSFDKAVLGFAADLPGWVLWLGQLGYVAGVLYTVSLLIGVGLVARHRLELLRDLLLAAGLAALLVVFFSWIADGRWPEIAFVDLDDTRETFPALFATTATAIQAAASPNLTAPMRKIGWTFVLAGRSPPCSVP